MFTWNKDWISLYESPWGIINKFLYTNAIYGFHAVKKLTTDKKREIETYRKNHIQSGIVSNYEIGEDSWLTHKESIEEYGEDILIQLLKPLLTIQNSKTVFNLLIRNNLYYCPECIKYGQHYMFHQFTFIKKCPIHNLDLLHGCNNCNNEIPYIIEFKKNLRHYGCKYCGHQLFDSDNLGESIDYWVKQISVNLSFEYDIQNEVTLIISDQCKSNLNDQEINKYLFSVFTKSKDKVSPKYIVLKGMSWTDIKLGNIITPNLSKIRKMEEYVYIFASQKFFRHIKQAKHLCHKLYKAEEYIRNCCPYYKILNENQINSYYKYFDLESISLYLWKRDIEWSGAPIHSFYMNKCNAYNYEFHPDYIIFNYIRKISKMFPGDINDDYKFNILVHMTARLMKDKYNAILNNVRYFYENNEPYELAKKIDKMAMNGYSVKNREFLLTINECKQEYKIYFDSEQ